METLETALNTDHPLAQHALLLMDALIKENGLQRLIEVGYEMLGNSFVICDMSFKTIAIINHSKIKDDPIWNELITAGYTSLNSAHYYSTNKLNQMVVQSEFPFFWSDPYSKYPRIMSKVAVGGKQVALLGIVAHEKPFQETDLELAALLAKAISIELQKHHFFHYSRGLMYENFIEDLLMGKITDREVIDERSKIMNINFRKNLYTLALDISGFDSTKSTLTYLRNQLEQMIPNSKAVVHNDNIALIIGCDNTKQFLKTEIGKFKSFLTTYNLYAGMSRNFHGPEEARDHYLQSVNALKLGMLLNKEDHLFLYEDYAVYHFVESCSGAEKLKQNCHPALLKLIEYDKENKTSFTRSLYTYILHAKNITESAQALNIHRNTMFYRLEKIDSLLDIDINNSNTLLHLHLSFKILELLEIDLP